MEQLPAACRQGWIFNIQRYSLHDGPGIRTIVFLKGCPLECIWCSNPESQNHKPELAYNSAKCIGVKDCGLCLGACPQKAIAHEKKSGKISLDRFKCKECFACADNCPAKALDIFGQLQSVSDIMKVVEEDSMFYARSGGGVTLSGGEPLSQGDFALEILKESKLRRINTAIETCGLAAWPALESCCRFLDSILFDIKCIDNEKHKKFTGRGNELILENFLKMCDSFPNLPKLVRTPVIPGFNDTHEDIGDIIRFIKDRPNVTYEVLPYHRMGQAKYEFLGKNYLLSGVKPKEEKTAVLKKMAQTWFSS